MFKGRIFNLSLCYMANIVSADMLRICFTKFKDLFEQEKGIEEKCSQFALKPGQTSLLYVQVCSWFFFCFFLFCFPHCAAYLSVLIGLSVSLIFFVFLFSFYSSFVALFLTKLRLLFSSPILCLSLPL